MPPRRGTRIRTRTRTTLATATATTPMTDAAIRALIAQSVADALAKQEIQRYINLNGDGSQGSGSGITRPVRPTHELSSISVTVQSRTKSSTCTHLGAPLTWWNSHVKTVGHDAAYGMPWKTLMEMMTVKYCPRSNVMSVRPKTMQEAIELTNDLIDQKVNVYAERQAKNKRKFDNNNQAQQQLPKRQNVAQAYAAGIGERKEYAGTLPLCNKCKFHHNGMCTTKCANFKKVGHLTRDRWNPIATSNQRTITCYECGNQGRYKSDFSELKNQNNGNQAEGTEARRMVYSLGGGETNQDLDGMEDDINA
ncbi:hypothetical protein Tco_0133832 [Tanacetum coccineum]